MARELPCRTVPGRLRGPGAPCGLEVSRRAARGCAHGLCLWEAAEMRASPSQSHNPAVGHRLSCVSKAREQEQHLPRFQLRPCWAEGLGCHPDSRALLSPWLRGLIHHRCPQATASLSRVYACASRGRRGDGRFPVNLGVPSPRSVRSHAEVCGGLCRPPPVPMALGAPGEERGC